MSYSQVRLKSNGNLKVYVIYFATVIASSSVSLKVLFRNCIFWVQIKMTRVRVKLIPNAPSNSPALASMSRKHLMGKLLSTRPSVRNDLLPRTFIVGLGSVRDLETFNRLFTILRVIPEQRKVDVFSSYWTDGYDQNVWQVVKIHMKLKKSCVD